MFNYVTLEFPLAQQPPGRLSYFLLNQRRFAHETATVRFRDWDIRYSNIKPGEPVKCMLRGLKSNREFVGYVYDIRPDVSPGKSFVDVTLIGASYRMKQARQRVFTNVTASDVARTVAAEHGLSPFVEDHPRVYEQIAQTGHTDLELLTRLAKQCGYTFRIENTSLYFQPLTEGFTKDRNVAPVFVMREANSPAGSTLYSFKLILGESVHYVDGYKSAAQVGGVNPGTRIPNIVTNSRRPEVTRQISNTEFFDSFATDIVAPDLSIAAYEAEALDQRNRFAYRADVEVIGTANISPDSPVYLDGIGPEYSGYWIVLSVQHRIVEEATNVLKYTTYLQVGTDSLGAATVWSDGKLIGTPDVVQVRNIIPNTTNTPINATSLLTNGSTTYNNDGFSTVKNRNNPAKKKTPYLWKAAPSSDTNAKKYAAKSNSTAVTKARVQKLNVL